MGFPISGMAETEQSLWARECGKACRSGPLTLITSDMTGPRIKESFKWLKDQNQKWQKINPEIRNRRKNKSEFENKK